MSQIKHWVDLLDYKEYLISTYNTVSSFGSTENYELLVFIKNEYSRVICNETYECKSIEIPSELSPLFYRWFHNTKLLEPIKGLLH